MVHSLGIQESARIRMAAIADFGRAGRRGSMRWREAGEGGGFGATADHRGVITLPTNGGTSGGDPADPTRLMMVAQHYDNVEWDEAPRPAGGDIWAGWNLGAEPARGDVVAEPPWWEKYQLPMLPSAAAGWGGGACPPVEIGRIADYEGGGVWRARIRGNDWRGAPAQ